jgi:hypothetical protein
VILEFHFCFLKKTIVRDRMTSGRGPIIPGVGVVSLATGAPTSTSILVFYVFHAIFADDLVIRIGEFHIAICPVFTADITLRVIRFQAFLADPDHIVKDDQIAIIFSTVGAGTDTSSVIHNILLLIVDFLRHLPRFST